jgi:hypothetical protein
MKLIYSIYIALFFLSNIKKTLTMQQENENVVLKKLLKENSTIENFKTNILINQASREKFLRILSRPYSQKKFNLSLFDINWDIGNLTYDANEGYKTSVIGGMQAGIAGINQNQMGAANNIKFFKSQKTTELIMNFFEDIQLRTIDKKTFFDHFSKQDTLDLYRNTYFFHYVLSLENIAQSLKKK